MDRRTSLYTLLAGCALLALGVANVSADDGGPAAARPPWRRPPAPPAVRMELLDDGGRPLRRFVHDGRGYVLGALGSRYRVRLVNPTAGRVEAVLSIDGLDAIDGQPASREKRGYVIAPFGETIVDGFRTSQSEVATFRFSSVRDSYAARKGDDRNVGVIGVAFFAERPPPPPPPQMVPRDDGASRGGAAPEGKSSPRPPAPRAAAAERPGLGTEFGERRSSFVTGTSFERASSTPSAIVELRYDDRDGLRRLGIPVDGSTDEELRRDAEPFPADRPYAQPPP